MFSGPDFLYVDQFFPRASVYVLCGKESMGPPPDPLRIANLSGALGNLENAMKSSLKTTYFITQHMKVDLHNRTSTAYCRFSTFHRARRQIDHERDVRIFNSNGAFQEESRRGRKAAASPGCGSVIRTTNRAIHKHYIISPPISLMAESSPRLVS